MYIEAKYFYIINLIFIFVIQLLKYLTQLVRRLKDIPLVLTGGV